MDLAADSELLDELFEQASAPRSDQQREMIDSIVDQADQAGLVHTAILGRTFQTMDLTRINDIEHVVGTLAEAQRLWSEHSDDVEPTFRPFLLVQMAVSLLILGEKTSIPVARLEALRANYEQLCRQSGHPLRVPYRFAMIFANRRGDMEAAAHYFAQTQAEPPDPMYPETPADDIEYLAGQGDDVAAVALYRGIDFSEPKEGHGVVHAAAILPLLRLGLMDEADRAHRASRPEDPLSETLSYLGLVGRFEEGLAQLVLSLAEDPDEPVTERGAAVMAAHAVVLLDHLRVAGRGSDTVADLDGASVDELHDRFRGEAERVAAHLDRVNRVDVAVPRLHRFWAAHLPAEGQNSPDLSSAATPRSP